MSSPSVVLAVGPSEPSHGPCSTEALCLGRESDRHRGCGCAGSIAMDIWRAAARGDLREVQRIVGEHPTVVNAIGLRYPKVAPLTSASENGHVAVVRWLLDKGAAINEKNAGWGTALWFASLRNRALVVKLLLEGGGDPAIAPTQGVTPLMIASSYGHLEVVRLLLDHPRGKTTINHRDHEGKTGGGPATLAVGARRGRCWRTGPTLRSPRTTAPPLWPSPSRSLRITRPPYTAARSAWRRWR
jgi:hypothetical protein